jgi:hypothetical protein
MIAKWWQSDSLQSVKQKPLELVFTLDNFNWKEDIIQWIKDNHQSTLGLIGRPAIGKTKFFKLITKKVEVPYFIVNQLQALKDLTEEHKSIIYDDFFSQTMAISFQIRSKTRSSSVKRQCYQIRRGGTDLYFQRRFLFKDTQSLTELIL